VQGFERKPSIIVISEPNLISENRPVISKFTVGGIKDRHALYPMGCDSGLSKISFGAHCCVLSIHRCKQDGRHGAYCISTHASNITKRIGCY
jgi:hypothetical protein